MSPELSRAAIGMGGNTGDVATAFAQALAQLAAAAQMRVLAVSSVWRTPPWGRTDQPDFLNAALLVETGLSPDALLDLLLAVETAAGRQRRERWGPRPLDLDIVDFAGLVRDDARLRLPHPYAVKRAFVIVPLAEIAPGLELGGRPVADWRDTLPDEKIVRDEAASAVLQGAFRALA